MNASRVTARAGVSIVGALVALLATLHVEAAPPVQVTAADPSSAPQGTVSLDVAISGSGFDASATVNFLVAGTTNPGGVTVKKVTVVGPKKLIATIDVADAAVVDKFDIQVQLSGGRKGKGTSLFAVLAKGSNDPCVAAINFPAFIYHQASGQAGTYAADQSGQCTRLLWSSTNAGGPRFGYPVKDDLGTPTDRGRIVKKFNNVYTAFDITVQGTTVTIGPEHLVADFGLGFMPYSRELSADGRYLYVSLRPELRAEGYVSLVGRIRLPADLGDLDPNNLPQPEIVFEHATTLAERDLYAESLVVNAANNLLYVNEYDARALTFTLLRVDLDEDLVDTGGDREVTPIPLASSKNFSLAADVSSAGSDLLALAVYSPQDRNFYLTIMNGRTGTVLNEGTSWIARLLTWSNGKVLANGHFSKGPYASSIVQLDPLSGTAVPLLTGSYPEGR